MPCSPRTRSSLRAWTGTKHNEQQGCSEGPPALTVPGSPGSCSASRREARRGPRTSSGWGLKSKEERQHFRGAVVKATSELCPPLLSAQKGHAAPLQQGRNVLPRKEYTATRENTGILLLKCLTAAMQSNQRHSTTQEKKQEHKPCVRDNSLLLPSPPPEEGSTQLTSAAPLPLAAPTLRAAVTPSSPGPWVSALVPLGSARPSPPPRYFVVIDGGGKR